MTTALVLHEDMQYENKNTVIVPNMGWHMFEWRHDAVDGYALILVLCGAMEVRIPGRSVVRCDAGCVVMGDFVWRNYTKICTSGQDFKAVMCARACACACVSFEICVTVRACIATV